MEGAKWGELTRDIKTIVINRRVARYDRGTDELAGEVAALDQASGPALMGRAPSQRQRSCSTAHGLLQS